MAIYKTVEMLMTLYRGQKGGAKAAQLLELSPTVWCGELGLI